MEKLVTHFKFIEMQEHNPNWTYVRIEDITHVMPAFDHLSATAKRYWVACGSRFLIEDRDEAVQFKIMFG